jgi:predicted Fe-Mo cluster-binding NifX family protein
MKIAVTAIGDTLDAAVAPQFSRCAHVLFIDTEDTRVRAFPNPYMRESGAEVGRRLAGWIARRGADVVLTGSADPDASTAFDAAGIQSVVDCSGNVRHAVEAFRADAAGSEEAPPRGARAPGRPRRRRRRTRRREHRGREPESGPAR